MTSKRAPTHSKPIPTSETGMDIDASDDIQVAHSLDTSGLFCPEPVMMLHNKIRDIEVGECLEIIATDPATERDIPKFCHFLGHSLLVHKDLGKTYRYVVRKQDSE